MQYQMQIDFYNKWANNQQELRTWKKSDDKESSNTFTVVIGDFVQEILFLLYLDSTAEPQTMLTLGTVPSLCHLRHSTAAKLRQC